MKRDLVLKPLIWFLFCLTIAGAQGLLAQDDFEEDLEKELEAELSLEGESGEDFAEEAADEEAIQPSAGEEIDSAAAEESFGSEDFGEEDLEGDFADDFEDEDFADLEEEAPGGEVAPEGEGLEPLNEDVAEEEILEPVPAEELVEEGVPEPVAEPPIEEPAEITEPVEQFADSRPDLEYEAQLHNIYLNYNSSPVGAGSWADLVGDRGAEIYQIQSKDTLWGISEVFFGDGQYWPKIWSLNRSIQNPHLISKGNQIQFMLGNLDNAPAFTISEKEGATESDLEKVRELVKQGALSAEDEKQFEEALKTQTTDQVEVSGVEERKVEEERPPISEDPVSEDPIIDIPPPSVVSRPVLKKLPPSVPEWQSVRKRSGNFDELGIDYGQRKIARLREEIDVTSFVDDPGVKSEAKIIEIEAGAYLALESQYVYVQFPKGRGVSGENYIVVQNGGELIAPNDQVDDDNMGERKRISGMLTLQQKVEADVGKDFVVYRAFVNRAIGQITVGSEVVQGKLLVANVSESGPTKNIVSQIIGGQFDESRKIFGKSAIVFINRGAQDGVRIGDILPVRSNQKLRNGSSVVLNQSLVIGKIKIIKVAKKFATAIVLDSSLGIRSGDTTGPGGLLSEVHRKKVESVGDDPLTGTGRRAKALDQEDADTLLDEELGDDEFGEEDLGEDDLESDFESEEF